MLFLVISVKHMIYKSIAKNKQFFNVFAPRSMSQVCKDSFIKHPLIHAAHIIFFIHLFSSILSGKLSQANSPKSSAALSS